MLNLQVLLLAVTVVATVTVDDSDWTAFKAKYGKIYKNQDEDHERRNIFEDNMKKIHDHNILFAKGLKSFSLGENYFTDMTDTEFNEMTSGFNPDGFHQFMEEPLKSRSSSLSLPPTVNWVKKGYVTPIKDLGGCMSCWAFSTTGSLEGAHAKQSGKLINLSEQNLIDCTFSYGNRGCNGGWMHQAFDYIIDNKGINTEKSYPYKAREGRCRFNRSNVGATMSSYVHIPSGSEEELKRATAEVGPISVAINAGLKSFKQYRSGIYDDPQCSSTMLSHAVLVVGYGSYNGKDYWLVKNCWGTFWGDKGYIKMRRNKNNQCGIASKAIYPIISSSDLLTSPRSSSAKLSFSLATFLTYFYVPVLQITIK